MRRGILGDERAGTTLVAAALMAVMLLMGVVLHDITALYGARGRAQTAADAAAKAAGLELTPYFGVGNDPHGAAREYAARNGAELLECACGSGGRFIWVTVRVSRGVDLLVMGGGKTTVTATARCYLDLYPTSVHTCSSHNPPGGFRYCVSRLWARNVNTELLSYLRG